jgi:hypothetical protein
MMLTEDEANGKFCSLDSTRCAGSDCMAWRWHDDGIVEHGASLSGGKSLGFRGLVGRPELSRQCGDFIPAHHLKAPEEGREKCI